MLQIIKYEGGLKMKKLRQYIVFHSPSL